MTADEAPAAAPAAEGGPRPARSSREWAELLLPFEARMRAERVRPEVKHEIVRDELGMAPERYYMLLGRLIDTTAAAEVDPILTRMLLDERRRANAKRAARGARILTAGPLGDDPTN
ncbi:DUF3263 domain-containing protein [Microbacterium excoecariae]|uniref:DUF3263 domain-containing protein n=1 Tax=Microbacterium excoecariae TaxID=2715210 RepID=UPI001408C78D|nr:DUF3263 domain-containing protein [Microbacterium excoecariae]NHI16837.1 DUF3263 domain-containing protein [Microbacterium excoecariae]